MKRECQPWSQVVKMFAAGEFEWSRLLSQLVNNSTWKAKLGMLRRHFARMLAKTATCSVTLRWIREVESSLVARGLAESRGLPAQRALPESALLFIFVLTMLPDATGLLQVLTHHHFHFTFFIFTQQLFSAEQLSRSGDVCWESRFRVCGGGWVWWCRGARR